MNQAHRNQRMLDRGLVAPAQPRRPRLLDHLRKALALPGTTAGSLARDSYLACAVYAIPILRDCGRGFPPKCVRERMDSPLRRGRRCA